MWEVTNVIMCKRPPMPMPGQFRQTHRQHSAAVHVAMLSCSYAGCRQRQAMAALLNGGMLACKQHDSSGRTAFANSAGGTIRTAHDANARAIPPDALTALRSCACSRAELLLCRLQAYAKQWLPCPMAGCLPASSMTAVAVRRRDSERGGGCMKNLTGVRVVI